MPCLEYIYSFCVLLRSGADETKQQTIINRESLELGKELGQGEFGSVLMGVWVDPIGERVSGNQFEHVKVSPCFLRENNGLKISWYYVKVLP